MANTVNKIPSINLPFTNEQGVIHPIWYEFLRSFISSVGDGGGGSGADNTVVAGAGILGTGAVGTVNVGQGEGIVVNANSVGVDIIHQNNAQAAPEDEILIADASDQSRIRKTSLRDVANLSPGTFPTGSQGAVQFNNNGLFTGDNTFIVDGAGNFDFTGDVDIVGSLDIDDININGSTFATPSSSTGMRFEVPAGGLNQFIFRQTGEGSSAMSMQILGIGSSTGLYLDSDSSNSSSTSASLVSFGTDNDGSKNWIIGLDSSSDSDFRLSRGTNNFSIAPIFRVDRGDDYFIHNSNMTRKTVASITASTTQTQGQGALTGDVNQISTCANNNDTVTLPGAQAGSVIYIINDGVATLQIFPASGDNLGAGLNTATTLATGGHAMFVAYNTTNWEQFI